MSKLSSLSFLIPAYNDEPTIERVIAEAMAVGKQGAKKFEIVVINDGSRDETARILEAQGLALKATLRVITHPVNLGYGRTIKELYFAGKGEWLFTIPGDYQVGAKELEKMIRSCKFFLSSPRRRGSRLSKIDSRWSLPRTLMRGGNDKEGECPDMTLGWRINRRDPPSRLFVSRVYNTLLRLLFGITLHDVNSVRLMRRSVLKRITLTSRSAFVDGELIIRAVNAGFRVIEVPISHRPRTDGSRGGGNEWRTIAATMVDMIRFLL